MKKQNHSTLSVSYLSFFDLGPNKVNHVIKPIIHKKDQQSNCQS